MRAATLALIALALSSCCYRATSDADEGELPWSSYGDGPEVRFRMEISEEADIWR